VSGPRNAEIRAPRLGLFFYGISNFDGHLDDLATLSSDNDDRASDDVDGLDDIDRAHYAPPLRAKKLKKRVAYLLTILAIRNAMTATLMAMMAT